MQHIDIPKPVDVKKEKKSFKYDFYTWDDVNLEDLISEGYEIISPKYISIVDKIIKQGNRSFIYSVNVYTKNRLFLKRAVVKIYKKKSSMLQYVESIATLSNNPSFIKFYEIFELDHRWCIIMDKIDGNLRDLIDKNLLGEMDIKSIAKQLLQYMNILDSQRRSHVDIRPENIGYVYQKNDIIIKLFKGKFIPYDHNITNVSISNYTDPYLIQLFPLQKISSYKIGLWSLGCIFHELVTGKTAFENRYSTGVENIHYINQRVTEFNSSMYTCLSNPDCFSKFIISIFLERVSLRDCLSDPYLN